MDNEAILNLQTRLNTLEAEVISLKSANEKTKLELNSKINHQKQILQFFMYTHCIDCGEERTTCMSCKTKLCKNCKQTANLKIINTDLGFKDAVCKSCSEKYEYTGSY